MTAGRGDAGRVSIFLAVALIGVLAIIGMAFDGAGQLRTLQRAENLAAEAAARAARPSTGPPPSRAGPSGSTGARPAAPSGTTSPPPAPATTP